MRILIDTSVLVAAMVEGHPRHAVALPWLQLVRQKSEAGLVAAHSLAELYAVLTRLPVHPRIPPLMAVELIRTNVLATCEVVALSEDDYVAALCQGSALFLHGRYGRGMGLGQGVTRCLRGPGPKPLL